MSEIIESLNRDIQRKDEDLASAQLEIRNLRYRLVVELSYWKQKDKANRRRAWEAEQIAIDKAKRIRKLVDKDKE